MAQNNPRNYTAPVDRVNVAARVPSTQAEGPGHRYALWVQGCPLRCPGCCNPHMLEFKEAQLWEIDDLARDIIETEGIEGLTLIGGEPFAQAEALSALAKQVRAAGLSVMVFSGFPYAQLQKREAWAAFLEHIDLLVSGPYIQAQHVTDRRWIGSANQQIHFLTERYARLEREGWDKGKNTIELRLRGNEIFINGFPHEDITEALAQLALRSTSRVKNDPKEETG